MRVVLQVCGAEVDVEVAVHDPAATVADLALAVSGGACIGSGLVIDGAVVSGSTRLTGSGLRPGCELSLPPGTDDPPSCTEAEVEAEVEVVVVGGLVAGARHGVPCGRSIIGRDSACPVVLTTRTTSSRHGTVFVEAPTSVLLADAGSTSGTWIDGRRVHGVETLTPDAVAALGASLVRIGPPPWREPAVLGPPGPDGRRPLLRSPAPASLPPPRPVSPPSPDPPAGDAPRFGWAAALVPLVGGVVLARLVDPRLALFTLLGPAVLIGQWVEDRRRHRRRGADSRVARRNGLATFASDLVLAGASESRRRRASHPDPGELGREIEVVGSELWSRRPGHDAFAEVSVGMGPALAWTPPTARPAEGPAAEVLLDARLPYATPATAELTPGSHLGIGGPASASLAVARWVILQLAAHHGPAHLRIAVLCTPSRTAEWAWTAFLPHTAAPGGAGRRLLATGPAELKELCDIHEASGGGSHLVVVVDGQGLVGGADIGGPASPLASLTVASSRRALPARCTSVLELDGPDGWGRLDATGAAPQAVLATGIDEPCSRRWARRLAGLADPEANAAGCGPPRSVRLLDLLGLDHPTGEEVRARWSGRTGAATPIGSTGGETTAETVHLDLVADGPHLLVAGTTGAGKSELLRSLVAGLAASSAPDRLVLLLVDYKGGAAFAEAARLPHVLGVVTDLGADEAARSLRSLEAEMRRREEVLAELGVRDLAAHPTHRPGPAPQDVEPLPRLVVVIDELAALVAELPSFLDGLVQLAARGRSLGLHLVLATQRPGSVVSAAVRTNCAIRCCLRVPDEADAVDVVGSAAPARLHRRQAGRAFLRRGAGDLVEVQVALVGGTRPADGPAVTVRPAEAGPEPPGRSPVKERSGATDLACLVAACRAAATDAGIPPPRPIWLPPLPPVLLGSGLPRHGEAVVIGLLDDPGHQRRLPLMWRPGEGLLLAVGTGPGPAGALQAAARALAGRLGPGALHVYGIGLAGSGLAGLDELPHVGAVLRSGEQERLLRLVQRLTEELAARQSAASAGDGRGGAALPLVLVLIDGLAGLRAALDGTGGLAALDALERVVVDGAALGMAVAVTADRMAAVPGAWTAAAARHLAFRGGDPLDLVALGIRRVDQSAWPAGRCVDLTSSLLGQVASGGWPDPATPAPDDRRAAARPVAALPTRVPLGPILASQRAWSGGDGLHLPIGIDGRSLEVAVARLRPGQPFLICGPPGAGRTTALAAVADAARAAGCEVVDDCTELVDRLAPSAGLSGRPPLVVLVDDAHRLPDDGALGGLARGEHPGAHLVATAPREAIRGAFGHWSADLRRAPAGLVLRPGSNLDADVLGIPLLPRWPVALVAQGRGVLVQDGVAVPLQVALP